MVVLGHTRAPFSSRVASAPGPRRVVVLVAGVLLLAACRTPPPQPVSATEIIGPYEVTMTAVPRPGVRRAFTFIVEVRGGPEEDPAFACPGTRWDYGDGTGLVGDPVTAFGTPCPASIGSVPRRLTDSHIYEKPGMYNVSFSHGAPSRQGLRGRVRVEVR